jgi:hypothetical protein
VELLEEHGFLKLCRHPEVKHHRLGLWPLLQASHRVASDILYVLEGAESVIVSGGTLIYVGTILPYASTLPHDGFEHLEVFDLAFFLLDEVVITEVDKLRGQDEGLGEGSPLRVFLFEHLVLGLVHLHVVVFLKVLVECARLAIRVGRTLLVNEVFHGLDEGEELLEEEFLDLHHEVFQGLLVLGATRVQAAVTQWGASTGQVVLKVQRVLIGAVVVGDL